MNTFLRGALGRGGPVVAMALSLLLACGQAQAAGTLAGTTISNKATLSYSVGSVAQPTIASSPTGSTSGTGQSTTFVVDNKVNVNVVTVDSSPVSVVSGQASVTATFVVSNTGNNVQDFSLSSANLANGTVITFGGTNYTDSFDVSSCSTTVNGIAQAFIGSLAPDQSQTVKVVCSVPTGQSNGNVSVVSLLATAKLAGSNGVTSLTATAGANDPNVVDIVFADGAGTDDVANQANFSSRSAFQVSTAALTVTKSVSAVCDPVNGGTNAKNIPGGYIQYAIQITNNGSASATLTQVTDTLATALTFDPDLISGSGAGTNCAAGIAPQGGTGKGFKVVFPNRPAASYPKYLTTSPSDTDGGAFSAGTVTINFSQALPAEGTYSAAELKVGDTVQVIFQVQIN